MKMSMIEMLMITTAISVIGLCCMKSNPEMMCKAKKIVKDTSKKIYTKLDELEKED